MFFITYRCWIGRPDGSGMETIVCPSARSKEGAISYFKSDVDKLPHGADHSSIQGVTMCQEIGPVDVEL